jgi:hypothetical protein
MVASKTNTTQGDYFLEIKKHESSSTWETRAILLRR